MLPDELKIQAQTQALQCGISLSEFIRRTLEQALQSANHDASADPLFADNAVFDGDSPTDLADRHDDYLYGETHS